MPIVFKYKNPINVSYAPGRTNIGEDGELGSMGKAGNALYFTNLELDNSYNIELTLQKIENNIILSSSSIGNITKIREYKINDLILSNSGKCYKIIQSTSESLFKNYKYDIEYIGQFKTKSSVNAIRAVFTKVDGTPAHYPVPNNAGLVKNADEYGDSDYELRTLSYNVKLYGIEYSPDSFYSEDPDNIEITSEEKDKRKKAIESITSGEYVPYRYSIQIRLKNTKQFYNQASPVTVEKLNDTSIGNDAENADNMRLSFYKTIEIPNVDLFKDGFYEEGRKDLEEYCNPTLFTVSDSMLDRLHPSKNNVYCTLNNSKDMWYKTGMYSEDGKFSKSDFTLSEDANKCDETAEKYGNSTVYIELKNRTYTEDGVTRHVDYDNLVSGFPKYTTASETDTENSSLLYKEPIADKIESELEKPNSKLLIKDRNNLEGTSLYFTSISNDEDCKREMENFLFSQNTTVYVIAKNLKTKEIVISEIPYELEEE